MLPYIHALPSGRLQFRRAFPNWLRPFTGRGEFIRSLKARSMDEPGAMERYRAANDNYETAVAVATKAAIGQFDTPSPEQLDWMVAGYVRERLAHDEQTRFDRDDRRFEIEALSSFRAAPMGFMDGASRREKALAGLPVVIADLKDAYASGDPDRILQIEGQNAEELAADHRLRLDLRGEHFAELCRKLLVADIAVAEKLLARFNGEPVATPCPPEPPAPSRHARAVVPKRSFKAIAEAEMDRPTFTAGPSTKQMLSTALRYFGELHGELEPVEITRSHATQLADHLALAPAKRRKSERHWPLPKIVAGYASEDVKRLQWKTRAAVLGALQAAWNRAQRSGAIDANLANPFARPSLGKAPPRVENEGLTRPETCAILALPVFAAGERPKRGKGEASYWLPILLLTTGARPEELAQLLVADIRHDEATGDWLLTISDEGEHPRKGSRRLKTEGSKRSFPLPKVVVELGFAEYVGWLRGQREAALFPALKLKGERGELFAGFGEWWSSYLREHRACPEGKRPAREFRHTWATIARESGVSREAQEYIMGHVPVGGGMNSRYGARTAYGREMHKVSFEGWGLEKVRRWSPPVE